MKKQTKICTECGCEYHHDSIEIEGIDLLASFTICDKCSEIIEGREAKAKRAAEALARWVGTIPAEYRKTSRDHIDFPDETYRDALDWLRGNPCQGVTKRLFLGIVGQSGRGKTRVVTLIAKSIIWSGEYVTWLNSAHFQWCCQNQFGDTNGKEAQKHLEIYRKTKNLVFDDIGSLKSTETVSDNLYALLEHRTANGLRMMWTSNESLDEILAGKGLTEKARSRSISRLGGFSNIIQL